MAQEDFGETAAHHPQLACNEAFSDKLVPSSRNTIAGTMEALFMHTRRRILTSLASVGSILSLSPAALSAGEDEPKAYLFMTGESDMEGGVACRSNPTSSSVRRPSSCISLSRTTIFLTQCIPETKASADLLSAA
jgi:hypothetical protein